MGGEKIYDKLFSPAKIGSLLIKNRIIMPAMATNFASETGGLTEHLVDYYKERARGGVGLIIIENTTVDYPLGRNGATQIRLDHDRFIPGLSRLVDEIHENGAKIAIQINHCGGSTDQSKTEGLQPVSCSPMPCKLDGDIPRELTVDEIQLLVEKFAQAAFRAKKAGFDSIEIHGGHGYLLAQFMSTYNNQRKDQYGGNLEGRIRFPLEVIKEVRKKVGQDYPLIFRISAIEYVKNGRKLEETIKIAKILEKSGINALNITVATAFNTAKQIEPITYPQGWRIPYSSAIKKVVNIPIITVGVIREPEFANQIIKQGDADFVAIGRGLIADPFWPLKAATGRKKEICKCISCNDGCINNRGYKDLPICCAVNPAAGKESKYLNIAKTKRPKNIVIIGGGPAGMEAARVSRLKGHNVILFEQNNELGGQMLLAAKPPGKDKIRWYIDYLTYQMQILDVDIKLNSTIDNSEFIKKYNPDIIILACGSRPIFPNVPGIENSEFVISAHELLKQNKMIQNKQIAVIGGGLVGCETAEYIEEKGNKVTIVEMLENIALDVNPVYREDIIERLYNNSNIKILKNTLLVGININNNELELKNCINGNNKKIICDFTVLACGARPNQKLYNIFQDTNQDTYLIGDCYCPGKILDAVASGSRIARLLD